MSVSVASLGVIALLALPPAGDPDEGQRSALTARLQTHAPRASVREIACGLHPSISTRAVNVSVDHVACGAPVEGALHANIQLETDEILVELDAPPDASADEMAVLQQGVQDIRAELVRRLPVVVVSVPVPSAPQPSKKARKSTPWFIASGIFAFLGSAAAGIGGGVTAVGGEKNDSATKSNGETILETCVAPLAVAALVTLTIGLVLALRGE
jgi:hypothetical protein